MSLKEGLQQLDVIVAEVRGNRDVSQSSKRHRRVVLWRREFEREEFWHRPDFLYQRPSIQSAFEGHLWGRMSKSSRNMERFLAKKAK